MFAAMHFPTVLLQPVQGVVRWWCRGAHARRARAEMALLASLRQHELNDLGIGHSELPAVLRPQR